MERTPTVEHITQGIQHQIGEGASVGQMTGAYCYSFQTRSEVGFKGKLCRGTVRGSRLMHWFADSLPGWGVHVVPCLWRFCSFLFF